MKIKQLNMIKTLAGISSITCVIFISLTHIIREHYHSFLIWYVSLVSIVYITIFIVLFFKQRQIKELKGSLWTYLMGVAVLIIYLITEL